SGRALAIDEADRADRGVGLGGVAEIEEELPQLAVFPVGEKKRLLAPGPGRGPTPEQKDDAQVGGDNGDVQGVHPARRFHEHGERSPKMQEQTERRSAEMAPAPKQSEGVRRSGCPSGAPANKKPKATEGGLTGHRGSMRVFVPGILE